MYVFSSVSQDKLEWYYTKVLARRIKRDQISAYWGIVISKMTLSQNNGLLKFQELGGGFKYFLFSPLFGEDSHLD